MAACGIPNTMRAVQYSGYGGGAAALKHVEVPVPSLKKNEVLVKVEASSINPADWKIQKGMLRPFLPRFPCIPGINGVTEQTSEFVSQQTPPKQPALCKCAETVTDVAGEIVQVGSAARELKVGTKVLCKLKFGHGGGLAEYVAASEGMTVARPDEVSAADAGGLQISGLTALQALTSLGTKFDGTGRSGANILVTGASGGVGTYAVQLAKLGNHHVTATCGARNLELVRSLGADEVLDYKTPEGVALTSPSGRKYDCIINTTDAAGWWSVLKLSLSSRGRVVDVTPNPANYVASALTVFSRKKISMLTLVSLGKEEMRFLLGLVAEGKLRTVVDSRYPFERAAEAWEKSMGGHATGKIIVEM